ncbi:hypothetical protein TRVA0_007S00540 [Trichomonascus vanleenenianus]|uniref:uncharacterized protein n=1 Tax=Trichomonascus vanleenenianus TaxID=2268995 RepID=UPI003ECA0A63
MSEKPQSEEVPMKLELPSAESASLCSSGSDDGSNPATEVSTPTSIDSEFVFPPRENTKMKPQEEKRPNVENDEHDGNPEAKKEKSSTKGSSLPPREFTFPPKKIYIPSHVPNGHSDSNNSTFSHHHKRSSTVRIPSCPNPGFNKPPGSQANHLHRQQRQLSGYQPSYNMNNHHRHSSVYVPQTAVGYQYPLPQAVISMMAESYSNHQYYLSPDSDTPEKWNGDAVLFIPFKKEMECYFHSHKMTSDAALNVLLKVIPRKYHDDLFSSKVPTSTGMQLLGHLDSVVLPNRKMAEEKLQKRYEQLASMTCISFHALPAFNLKHRKRAIELRLSDYQCKKYYVDSLDYNTFASLLMFVSPQLPYIEYQDTLVRRIELAMSFGLSDSPVAPSSSKPRQYHNRRVSLQHVPFKPQDNPHKSHYRSDTRSRV